MNITGRWIKEKTSKNIDSFRVQYWDVHARRHPTFEIIPARDATAALAEFSRRRRNEHWTRFEILIDSVVLIINESTNENFAIDEQGVLSSSP